jgi:hypothetical protein
MQNKAASEAIQKQAHGAGALVAKAASPSRAEWVTLIDTNREFLDTASQLTKSAG